MTRLHIVAGLDNEGANPVPIYWGENIVDAEKAYYAALKDHAGPHRKVGLVRNLIWTKRTRVALPDPGPEGFDYDAKA